MNLDRIKELAGLNESFGFRAVISYEEAAQMLGVTDARVAQLVGSFRLDPGIYIDDHGGERRGVTYASVLQLLGKNRQSKA